MVNKQVREVTTAEFGDLVNGEWPARFAGRAEVVKVNIDESREFAAAHAVRRVPKFLLFVGSKAVDCVVGASCEHSLAAVVESYLSAAQAEDTPPQAA